MARTHSKKHAVASEKSSNGPGIAGSRDARLVHPHQHEYPHPPSHAHADAHAQHPQHGQIAYSHTSNNNNNNNNHNLPQPSDSLPVLAPSTAALGPSGPDGHRADVLHIHDRLDAQAALVRHLELFWID
ncbi:hypothetical protein, variant [Exophiala xenobiotica]|uniref:Uncharacterized protein n=1 Tax=Exophiala xenobiotica TaxID=348802 RepID=A0A0D2CPJ3_9EURO|nr:hypothetical protein, variant [Exophiala xenobiotica]XP_013312467.1 uncharacterized protein PV05_10561 [Exophiala xenobiotica]KIW51882.1 hypothetical protein PV05_10561 [Exophiala xenobiotica]KIW51883.1 hypothetical protein, variant [Exophiala xenobiotica]